MSLTSQIIAVLIFLGYSAAYLFFVAWASERAASMRQTRKPSMASFVVGVLLPFLGLVLVLIKV
mgnify:CR=1 FL=1